MQKIGSILLLLGTGIFVIFGGAGFIGFLSSPEVSILIKIAVLSIAGGVILIILSSLKENWGKKDKYEEVKK